VIDDVRSSTAIAGYLFRPSTNIHTLSRDRLSFSFDLVEALFTKLLISMLHGLYNWIFICDHALPKHRRRSVGVVWILSTKYLLMLFGINLGLILSLLHSID
jgi:hypothetical protein